MSRNREAYIIKVIALSIALATSIIIILFSLHEFGYDRFHQDAPNAFRVIQKNVDEHYSGNRLSAKIDSTFGSLLIAPRCRDSLLTSRVKIMHRVNVVANGQSITDHTIHAVDPTIDAIFSMHIVDGNLKAFKTKKQVAIISSQFAEQYWNTTQAAGENLKLSTIADTVEVSVAAVFKSFPQNSHDNFDILILYDPSLIERLNFNTSETGIYGRTLVKKPEHYHFADETRKATCFLQPITDIYFGPRVLGEAARHGDHYSVIILICITALILFLALTTFINLTTITLPYRSKELAVKKLAGTTREMLIFGFIRESLSLVGISLAISLLVLFSLEGFIESILGFRVTPLIANPDFSFVLITLALLSVIVIAPIFMTIRFVQATPNRLLSTDTITFPALKRSITFIQLGISILLIIASVVVRRQINYSLIKEPGQNHDQIVYLNSPSGITNEGVNALRTGWKKFNPNILDVMAISQLPDRVTSKEINSEFYQLAVDPGFREFFHLQMQEGFWFGPNSSDSSFVINQAARKNMTNPDEHVLGVIADINSIFDQPEKPLKIKRGSDYGYNWLCVRVLEVDIRRTVQRLSEAFSTGNQKPTVHYLSDNFRSWIDYQDRLNRLSGILTIIAALLSCCTVYALSVSLVRDKLKQIALHRLFGANTTNITILLIREFAKQLCIALIVFLPVAYISMNEFLRTFVYSTDLSWFDAVYPLAYCVIVIITICTFQAWNLKRMNSITAIKG